MHYPNLAFHGVEAIRLGFNTPHRCMYGWQPGRKFREVAISDVLLPDCSRFTGHSEAIPKSAFGESVKAAALLLGIRIGCPYRLSMDHGVPCLFLQSTSKPVEISGEPNLYGDEKSQFEPFDQVSGRSEPDKTFSG
jgi:hypothetical protein